MISFKRSLELETPAILAWNDGILVRPYVRVIMPPGWMWELLVSDATMRG